MIPYGQLSTIKLYICHDSKLVAYEIIEPSLRSKTISVANLDRAFTTYSESKPKVLILLSHILDSSVWQDEFISRDVVNSESILTRLIRISCNHIEIMSHPTMEDAYLHQVSTLQRRRWVHAHQ